MLATGAMLSKVFPELEKYCARTIVLAELQRGLRILELRGSQDIEYLNRKYLFQELGAYAGFWVPFDAQAARGYSELRGASAQMRKRDALIAGHAKALGLPVHTADADFGTFEGVEIIRHQQG